MIIIIIIIIIINADYEDQIYMAFSADEPYLKYFLNHVLLDLWKH